MTVNHVWSTKKSSIMVIKPMETIAECLPRGAVTVVIETELTFRVYTTNQRRGCWIWGGERPEAYSISQVRMYSLNRPYRRRPVHWHILGKRQEQHYISWVGKSSKKMRGWMGRWSGCAHDTLQCHFWRGQSCSGIYESCIATVPVSISLAGDQYLHEAMADMSLIDIPVDLRHLLWRWRGYGAPV